MPAILRIGTRNSPLAVWQANYVSHYLESQNFQTQLVYIQSDGDHDLISPLYEFGVQGIFTKMLDLALLRNDIDIAVHSLKDVPTVLPKGLNIACIPPRGNFTDVLVHKGEKPIAGKSYIVATSSLRRKAQWLHYFGRDHTIENIRGNINTRLDKLQKNDRWQGMIFAAAGIERINLQTPDRCVLDWMIPAPAQGALGIVTRESDTYITDILKGLHCEDTSLAVNLERKFMRNLEGGCTMPLGCLVKTSGHDLIFNACLLDPDGEYIIEKNTSFLRAQGIEMVEKIVLEFKKHRFFSKIKRSLQNVRI